ncbi:unnamed protein product, partial [marine sediment metagenome]
MFKEWVGGWAYFEESYSFIYDMVEVFMTTPFVIHYQNNMIIFMKTTDKNFYIMINDPKYPLTKREQSLFNKWRKTLSMETYCTTRISYSSHEVAGDFTTQRKNLAEWFILFDICQIRPLDNVIKVIAAVFPKVRRDNNLLPVNPDLAEKKEA